MTFPASAFNVVDIRRDNRDRAIERVDTLRALKREMDESLRRECKVVTKELALRAELQKMFDAEAVAL